LPDCKEPKILQKGFLIVIEGIDGAGKTTQAQMLTEKLQSEGYPTVSLHEPTDSPYGQTIRNIAKGNLKVSAEEELNLFVQDRILDVKQNIQPALTDCKIVIMDRYYFSSIAYQGARGLNLTEIEQQNKAVAPEPDLLIILDVKPDVSLNRIRLNRAEGPNEFENNIRLEKSRAIFNSFQNRSYTKIVEGNSQLSPKEISNNIWNIVKPLVAGLMTENNVK
jgi:dTMP kinase